MIVIVGREAGVLLLMLLSLFRNLRMKGRAAKRVPQCRRARQGSGTQGRSRLEQGLPASLSRRCAATTAALFSVLLQLVPNAAQACGSDAPQLQAWPGSNRLWWVQAARGDADAGNRGLVSNLLIVRDGRRVWAVGSGPSRAFGRALGCVVRRDVGRPISDVISPWPRPELVLGAAGLPGARHWAHADVAQSMRQQCARCVQRLRQRLGAAANDLGAARAAVNLPRHLLRGEHGRLGPFTWWRVERAAGVPLTWWHLPDAGVLTAHGVLWSGDAPDLRDSRIDAMQAATARLSSLAEMTQRAPAATSLLLLGEQGDAAGSAEVSAHRRYWQALDEAVRAAQAQGADGLRPPLSLPGIDDARLRGAAHALNWQRAWRQAEDEALRLR